MIYQLRNSSSIWSVTTKYKHLQNLFVCIHLCLLCFCVWDAESPGLFDVVLHRKNQRSAHPTLTIFQSQTASEASLPGLTPGFQESLHMQRHFQSTSWSFELSVLAARKLWEMRIVSWLFGGYDNANLLQAFCRTWMYRDSLIGCSLLSRLRFRYRITEVPSLWLFSSLTAWIVLRIHLWLHIIL